ncbi:hypothetical protein Tco_0129563 [Tanacetum coccineum]
MVGFRCGMSFGVATLRALVHAGDKTSRDTRSWYMISRDAKSWVRDCSAYIHCHIAQLCVINKGICEVSGIKDEYIWEFIEGQLACHAALIILHDVLEAMMIFARVNTQFGDAYWVVMSVIVQNALRAIWLEVMSTLAYVDSETITQADGA